MRGETDMIVPEEAMGGMQIVLIGGHQVQCPVEVVQVLIMVVLAAQSMIGTMVHLMTGTGALNTEDIAGGYLPCECYIMFSFFFLLFPFFYSYTTAVSNYKILTL